MFSDAATFNSVGPLPLTTVFIGGLLTHRRLDASTMLRLAAGFGLDHQAAARAVLELIGRGLASVMRGEDGLGEMIATPAVDDLEQPYRVRCAVAHLVAARSQAVCDA